MFPFSPPLSPGTTHFAWLKTQTLKEYEEIGTIVRYRYCYTLPRGEERDGVVAVRPAHYC